jgi:hypothetical protein
LVDIEKEANEEV